MNIYSAIRKHVQHMHTELLLFKAYDGSHKHVCCQALRKLKTQCNYNMDKLLTK